MTDSDGVVPRMLELPLSAGGVWLVRSSSATQYFVDLDSKLLLRAPGPGSPTGAYDGCWVPLVGIEALDLEGRDPDGGWDPIKVGRRHIYHTDPRPDSPSCPVRWWLQREAVSIELVSPDARPAGRTAAPDEDNVPYR